jgi:hypothetical protein
VTGTTRVAPSTLPGAETDNAGATTRHYHWAGLDFMLDAEGAPVFIEANRASHMLGEYMQVFGDERPFALTAGVMNASPGPPCFLWRRQDPVPGAEEDACFIGRHLSKHLRESPIICDVEDNQEPRDELQSRDGRTVRPGSLFRWWYGLPWTCERSGTTVINPNCVWVTVRDKLACAAELARATSFRVPRGFAVDTAADVERLRAEHAEVFRSGYVLKPRIGWGGHSVQVADAGETPRAIDRNYLLTQRILPPRPDGRYWEARVFVMAGKYLGGLRHSSRSPLTNYWQGGALGPLDDKIAALLERPALEAVRLIDAAAEKVHTLPVPPHSPLTEVMYEGTGMPGG